MGKKSLEIVEFQKTELDLRRKEQALEERAQAMELEVQRKLDAERKAIAAETTQRLTEEHRLKEQELEKRTSNTILRF